MTLFSGHFARFCKDVNWIGSSLEYKGGVPWKLQWHFFDLLRYNQISKKETRFHPVSSSKYYIQSGKPYRSATWLQWFSFRWRGN
jgi:hypothetical protein